MHSWTDLLAQLAHDTKLQAELAAIMWREAVRWPDGELTTQLAKNTGALAGIARVLDKHGVRVPRNAIALTERGAIATS